MSKATTDKEMIDYLIDCTLATVELMLSQKRVNKTELERQCMIAQTGIDYLGVNYPFTSRASDIVKSKQTVQLYYNKDKRL